MDCVRAKSSPKSVWRLAARWAVVGLLLTAAVVPPLYYFLNQRVQAKLPDPSWQARYERLKTDFDLLNRFNDLTGEALWVYRFIQDQSPTCPDSLAREVAWHLVDAARAKGVPVPVAVGMAAIESNFWPRSRSPAGALGVLQVHWQAHKKFNRRLLLETRYGIDAGLTIFNEIRADYPGLHTHLDQILLRYVGAKNNLAAGRAYVAQVRAKMARYVLFAAGLKRPWARLAPPEAKTEPAEVKTIESSKLRLKCGQKSRPPAPPQASLATGF